jgi:hypothetical protein
LQNLRFSVTLLSLTVAILTMWLPLVAAQADEVGRVHARAGALLRAQPDRSAKVVRALLEGDELVPLVADEYEHAMKPAQVPRGWAAYSTIEVDSQRLFFGYLPATEVSPGGPSDARRLQILQHAAQTMLSELATRAAHFASLRQRRDLPTLASYMDEAITPLLQDTQDVIGELRDLSDPLAPALQKQLTKLTGQFKP